MARANKNAVLLNQEIAAVVTAMRQNSKWALIPTRYTDEDPLDDPLLDDFKLLRRRVFQWQDWSQVDPQEYMGPFLEVIRSPETSGPITGVALTSVCRMLEQDCIGQSQIGYTREVMQATADAITQCKFEATDPAADEVVLFKILQVLLACMKCPGGTLLTNDNVINIFQACFRIGHYQTERSKDMSELLTQASRQIMTELVRIIFARLAALEDVPMSPETAKTLASHTHSPRIQVSPMAGPATYTPFAGGDVAVGDSLTPVAEENGVVGSTDTEGVNSNALHHTVTLGPPSSPKNRESGSLEDVGHGLDCIGEVLGFIISLIGSEGEGVHSDLNVFGLDLMFTALNAAGSAFEKHEVLMAALREDLFQALFVASRAPNLSCLSGVSGVALALYCHLGHELLLQLEATIRHVLLRLAEGKGATGIEQQEAALEALLDFCNQPAFIRDIYANLDCRIERTNLFESIAALLSKTAFPVNSPLGSVHLLSLDGLFSILSALAASCDDTVSTTPESVFEDPEEYVPVFAALCGGQPPPLSQTMRVKGATGEDEHDPTEVARMEKYIKARLAVAADHFNRDYKKGFQFLQTVNLLPKEMNPEAVAQFLRSCPGLSKVTIGELLGENDDFYLNVLEAFTNTFTFQGLSFDMSLRVYLESFRLPGEAQKINRVMEAFGRVYHRQCPEPFKSADAVYVLGYSCIMLNTDQHNQQVKKKMTCEEFIRNNRGINEGADLPQDFLRGLFDSISRNEIRISSESQQFEVSPALWMELQQASRTPRGRLLEVAVLGRTDALDRDMFSLTWGPTVAAVSVVLDHADDAAIARQALDGLMLAAKLAAYHNVDEVIDSIVVSLSKFTNLLNPNVLRPAVAFGESEKARLATETVFVIANRYGDRLRSGWRNVADFCVRLYRLDLLPVVIFQEGDEELEGVRARLPRANSSARRAGPASHFFSRAISSLISIDPPELPGGQQADANAREVDAAARTAACIEACQIPDLIWDSDSLQPDSLLELVKALMWMSGPVARIAATGEEADAAEICLELIVTVVLRNRTRAAPLWPLLHTHITLMVSAEHVRAATPLAARAVSALLRLTAGVIPVSQQCADAATRSLQLLRRLNDNVAWELAEKIAAEVQTLVRVAGRDLRGLRDWRTICDLIVLTTPKPESASMAFETLRLIATSTDGLLTPVSFSACQQTVVFFLERHAKDEPPARTVAAVDLLESMLSWLVGYAESAGGAAGADPEWAKAVAAAMPPSRSAPSTGGSPTSRPAVSPTSPASRTPSEGRAQGGSQASTASSGVATTLSEQWTASLKLLARTALEPSEELRDRALAVLHRTIIASEGAAFGAGLWVDTLSSLVCGLVADLARLVAGRSREHPGCESSLRKAVQMLSKTLLQYLMAITADPGFPDMWARVMQVFQESTRNKSEELMEAVPETMKNMLLVMASQEVLVPEWKDSEGHNLWDLTWLRARQVSSALTPALLQHTGLAGAPPPPPLPPPQAPPTSPPQPSGPAPDPQAAPLTPTPFGSQQLLQPAADGELQKSSSPQRGEPNESQPEAVGSAQPDDGAAQSRVAEAEEFDRQGIASEVQEAAAPSSSGAMDAAMQNPARLSAGATLLPIDSMELAAPQASLSLPDAVAAVSDAALPPTEELPGEGTPAPTHPIDTEEEFDEAEQAQQTSSSCKQS